jgi:hypothetical protein
MPILDNPLNESDNFSMQTIKELGEKLVIEGMVNRAMKNNSYSEDLITYGPHAPSVTYLQNLLNLNNNFFSEALSPELIPADMSLEEENNYKFIFHAFLAILSEEEIQEFRSWYL